MDWSIGGHRRREEWRKGGREEGGDDFVGVFGQDERKERNI
jgi:hypothetical protein